MKYLKTFENTLKHSDPISLNHPLKEFSEELENIIKNSEIKNSEVKRYFNQDHSISIKIFHTTDEILKIKLLIQNNHIFISVTFSTWEFEKIKKFVEFFREKTMKYNLYDKPFKICLFFNKSETNNILEILKEYEIQIQGNKYNL